MVRYNVYETKVVDSKVVTRVIAKDLTKGRAKAMCESKNEEVYQKEQQARIEGELSMMVSYLWLPEGTKVNCHDDRKSNLTA